MHDLKYGIMVPRVSAHGGMQDGGHEPNEHMFFSCGLPRAVMALLFCIPGDYMVVIQPVQNRLCKCRSGFGIAVTVDSSAS